MGEENLIKSSKQELENLAIEYGIYNPKKFKKEELIELINKARAEREKSNSDVLLNKSIEDLKKMALSMGLMVSENFSKEDYLRYITANEVTDDVKYTRNDLLSISLSNLREYATKLKIKSPYKYKKDEIIDEILAAQDKFVPADNSMSFEVLKNKAEELGIEVDPGISKRDLLERVELLEEAREFEEYSNEEDEEEESIDISKIDFADLSDNATEALEHMEEANLSEGVLEVHSDGYGFLRVENYLSSDGDIYVAPSQIRRFRLKIGDLVKGITKAPNNNDGYKALIYIKSINGMDPNEASKRKNFDSLTPLYPREKLILEYDEKDLATRLIDLVAPIGKGQRGLIVSQPKSGKTTLIKRVATAISKRYPEVHLIVLLIDERPEEVTDMKRSINGEVAYSTFDEQPKNHIKVSEMVIERAKRLVEQKQDVVILLDSLTRLTRAYNIVTPPSGKTLSGGLDPLSLHKPKSFFGAARNVEEGGSLTIIATALIETGSRMDDVIFEEFKGTGNMELHLDRKLSERRIFPAIDINKSGTRKEELLLNKDELEFAWNLRRAMGGMDTSDVTELVLDNIVKTKNNRDFIKEMKFNKILYL